MAELCFTPAGNEETSISSSTFEVGQQYNTGNLPSFSVKTVQCYLRKIGSPTETISMHIYDNSGSLVETSTTTINASSLPTSFDTSPNEFSFSGVSFSNGYYWAIDSDSTLGSGNEVSVRAGSNDYADTQMILRQSGGWATRARDCYCCLTDTGSSPSSDSLLLPPPYSEVVF
jgi:hypothetical protein